MVPSLQDFAEVSPAVVIFWLGVVGLLAALGIAGKEIERWQKLLALAIGVILTPVGYFLVVSVSGDEARLAVAPSDRPVQVGETTLFREIQISITLANEGGSDLVLGSARLDPTSEDAHHFRLDDSECAKKATLAPDTSCILSLTARAREAGTWTVDVLVDLPGEDEPVRIPAVATVAEASGEPALDYSPVGQPIDVGSTDHRTSSNSVVVLRNSGDAPLQLNVVRLSPDGDGTDHFALDATACSNNELAPQESCELAVTLLGVDVGTWGATIEVEHGAASSAETIEVVGTVEALPIIRLSYGDGLVAQGGSPISLRFDTVSVGQTAEIDISLSNAGGGVLQIFDPTVEPNDYFGVTGCRNESLATAEDCILTISFRPISEVDRTVVLAVEHSGTSTPWSARLQGLGSESETPIAAEGGSAGTLFTDPQTGETLSILQGQSFRAPPLILDLSDITVLGTPTVYVTYSLVREGREGYVTDLGSVEVVDLGMRVVLSLRQLFILEDGTPLDAERIRDAVAERRVRGLSGIEVVDDQTIVFVFDRPGTSNIEGLATIEFVVR